MKRIVSVIAVAALMAAMLAANAMPALAKADVKANVLPKYCEGDPAYFCQHTVANHGGNFNEHHTTSGEDFRQHTNTHSKF